jgi:hypothetical protein
VVGGVSEESAAFGVAGETSLASKRILFLSAPFMVLPFLSQTQNRPERFARMVNSPVLMTFLEPLEVSPVEAFGFDFLGDDFFSVAIKSPF